MDSDEKLVHISQTDLSISSLSNQLEVYAVLRCTASQFCDEHIRLGFKTTRVSAYAYYTLLNRLRNRVVIAFSPSH